MWSVSALATFSSQDASLFHLVLPAEPIRNLCGAFGAHVAAFAYVLFGAAAWTLLLPFAWMAPLASWQTPNSNRQRLIGFTAFVISATAVSELLGFTAGAPTAGGVIGAWALLLHAVIGLVGCSLLYTTVMIVSALQVMQVSYATALAVTRWAVQHALQFSQRALKITFVAVLRSFRYLYRRAVALSGKKESPESVPLSVPLAVQYGRREELEDLDAYHMPKPQQQTPAPQPTQTVPHLPKVTPLAPTRNVEELIISDVAEAEGVSAESVQFVQGDETALPYELESITTDADDDEYWRTQLGEETTEEIPLPPLPSALPTPEPVMPVQQLASDAQPFVAHEYLLDEDDEEEEAAVVADEIDEDEAYSFKEESSTARQVTPAETVVEPTPEYQPAPAFALPPMTLFATPAADEATDEAFMQVCADRAKMLASKLAHFGVNGRVAAIHPGPVVTLFEYEPEVGSKVSKIVALEDDLALSLRALSIRIIAPVPGKNVVGFEIANEARRAVMFSDIAAGDRLLQKGCALPLALGVDIIGNPVIGDLSRMPHLLVAGATGSGKSVGMNVMLVSLLCARTPDQMRLILIDPKRLEFAPYADIPHLLFPIITNPHEVAPVLKWVVQEMEMRYEVMAQAGVRNIADYHRTDPAIRFAREYEMGVDLHGLPYIVIMVDELADLMMVAGKEVEMLIARIAQMARAAGIHMIVATQRPSVDVVTGIIKVNFPSRIAFRVSTKIDSRTIIDGSGAEKLLGKGDMLCMSPTSATLQRLHGAYVTDAEVDSLTDYLKAQRQVSYFSLQQIIAKHSGENNAGDHDGDPLYDDVCDFLQTVEEVSISLLQRKYRVGFNRSARLIEMLERDGHIAPAQGSKPRRVLRD